MCLPDRTERLRERVEGGEEVEAGLRGPERKAARSRGPDMKGRSEGRGPERGVGWRGMEAKETELSKEEAVMVLVLVAVAVAVVVAEWEVKKREVERGVEALALTAAPEMEGKEGGQWEGAEERR